MPVSYWIENFNIISLLFWNAQEEKELRPTYIRPQCIGVVKHEKWGKENVSLLIKYFVS